MALWQVRNSEKNQDAGHDKYGAGEEFEFEWAAYAPAWIARMVGDLSLKNPIADHIKSSENQASANSDEEKQVEHGFVVSDNQVSIKLYI